MEEEHKSQLVLRSGHPDSPLLGPLLPGTVPCFLLSFLSLKPPLSLSLPFSKIAVGFFAHCVCTFVMLSQRRTPKK